MSNVARTLAITINTTFMTKYRPGQTLSDSDQKAQTFRRHPWDQPPTGAEYPILRVRNRGVHLSIIGEEPIWVERVWIGVHRFVVEDPPAME